MVIPANKYLNKNEIKKRKKKKEKKGFGQTLTYLWAISPALLNSAWPCIYRSRGEP